MSIYKDDLSDEVIFLAQKILDAYPANIDKIAGYLVSDEGFICFYDGVTKDEVAEKLNTPQIRVDNVGGILTYLNHQLDDEHIIDVDFSGVFETFNEVLIDG